MTDIKLWREKFKNIFESRFVHKGEDGDDKPIDWGWTISAFPIEVQAECIHFIETIVIPQVRSEMKAEVLAVVPEKRKMTEVIEEINGGETITFYDNKRWNDYHTQLLQALENIK